MKKLINYLRNSSQKKVVIIGDLMLDEYFGGSVHRISPEAPVPVLKEEYQDWCLGGAANVAANCKHIGFDVSVIGVINDYDYAGQKILTMLNDLKISTEGIIRSTERPTTCKKRFLAKNHQMLRMDIESCNALSEREFSKLASSIDKYITPSSLVLISDYAKGVITQEVVKYILQCAKDRNCVVMVDPKGPHFDKYKSVNYLKPNAKEFGQMVEFFGLPSNKTREENGRAICKLLDLKGLVITLGEKGILYIDEQRNIFFPALKREVYDLTGAGDTVFAFLALGFAHNLAVDDCIKLANHAAGVAVSHTKTYAVSLEELIDRTTEPSEKIYQDWAQLKIELDWQKEGGRRIVLTNGCFDILHPGHIHTLKEAKKCGDILVVALNTDQSVQRLKGPTRPINDLQHRAIVISAIGFVDFVVSFDQDTPQALIEYLRPDILVKGGDYIKEQVVGYDIVTSYGGSVHIIDYIPEKSTTACIEKIASMQNDIQEINVGV